MNAGTLILKNESWFSRTLVRVGFGFFEFENYENTNKNAS